MGIVEKKVLYALIDMADKDRLVCATKEAIAHHIGYKRSGGAITWALSLLKEKGKIQFIEKRTYKVMV